MDVCPDCWKHCHIFILFTLNVDMYNGLGVNLNALVALRHRQKRVHVSRCISLLVLAKKVISRDTQFHLSC